jgi:hypothetical protein
LRGGTLGPVERGIIDFARSTSATGTDVVGKRFNHFEKVIAKRLKKPDHFLVAFFLAHTQREQKQILGVVRVLVSQTGKQLRCDGKVLRRAEFHSTRSALCAR